MVRSTGFPAGGIPVSAMLENVGRVEGHVDKHTTVLSAKEGEKERERERERERGGEQEMTK